MAGDEQRQRIPAAGLPDCPRGSGAVDGAGHFEIGARLPERDPAENVPDLALERGAGPHIKGQGGKGTAVLEILQDRFFCLGQHRVFLSKGGSNPGIGCLQEGQTGFPGRIFGAAKMDQAEAFIAGSKEQPSQRGCETPIVQLGRGGLLIHPRNP
jgi:hypothetical protein